MISRTGLTPIEFAAGILIKLVLGWLYGYIYLHYYNGDDTWKHFYASLRETKLLLDDPAQFFRNEYTPLHSIAIGKGWIDVLILYFNDLQYALFVKSMAFVNLVTGGRYYLNMIVFNAVVFWGHVWLFKLLKEYFPGSRRNLFVAIFLFLPAVFWVSGYRIEGLLFFFLSYFFFQLVAGKKRGIMRYIYLGGSLGGVFLCRPEVGVLVVIAATAFILSKKYGHPPRIFAAVYMLAVLLYFASEWIFPGKGLPSITTDGQQQFLKLEGTRFEVDTLTPTLGKHLQLFPEAVANTFFRPLPWEAKGMLQWMAAGEIIIFWLMAVMCVVWRHEQWRKRLAKPVILMLLALGVSVYVSVGYVVMFPGAIIRYKAVAEILLIGVMGAVVRDGRRKTGDGRREIVS